MLGLGQFYGLEDKRHTWRAREIAEQRGVSLSAVLADLAVRGLAQLHAPVTLRSDERTGLPVLSIGRPVTSDDVAAALDDV